MINFSEKEPWNGYLQKQRLAKITIYGELEVTDTLGYLSEIYNFKSNRQLKLVQDYLISQILKGEMGVRNIDRLKFNRKQLGLSKLILDKYLLKYAFSATNSNYNLNKLILNFRKEIGPKISSDILLLTYFKIRMKHWGESTKLIGSNIDIYNELFYRGYYTKSMAIFALKAIPHYSEYISGKEKAYTEKYYGFESFDFPLPLSIINFYMTDSIFRSERKNWNDLIQFFIGYNKFLEANQLINAYQSSFGYDPEFRFIQLVINYTHPSDDNGNHAKQLMDELPRMGNEKWCKFFFSKYSPSFQILDYQPIWELYCKECSQ